MSFGQISVNGNRNRKSFMSMAVPDAVSVSNVAA